MWHRPALVSVCLLTLLAAEPVSRVWVTADPPTVQVRYFDPRNLPDPPPPLPQGLSACTQWELTYQADIRWTVLGETRGNDGHFARLRVDSIAIVLRAPITIWLPNGASARLKDHEDGHRAIVERHYAGAQQAMEQAARKQIGQVVVGSGPTVEAARQAAIDVVNRRLEDAHKTMVLEPASAVSRIYDELTDHGRRLQPTARQAVEMAFARFAAGPATTRAAHPPR